MTIQNNTQQPKTDNSAIIQHAIESQPFTVYTLGKDDANLFMSLQDQAINGKKGHHLKSRTQQDIQKQLDSKNVVLGIHDNKDNHIAQCILAFGDEEATTNVTAFNQAAKYVAIQSVAFKVGFKPRELSEWDSTEKPDSLLFEEAKKIAKESGVTHIFAKVNANHTSSIKMFERAGFTASHPKKIDNDSYESCVMTFKVAVASHAVSIAKASEPPVILHQTGFNNPAYT